MTQDFGKVIRSYEIGVIVGVTPDEYPDSMLTNTNVKLLYGIRACNGNIYRSCDIKSLGAEINESSQNSQERSFADRYKFIDKTSEDALVDVGEVDFVFINGVCSYNDTWDDLCMWYKKVKIGGVIAGRCCNHTRNSVRNQVTEFFSRFGWKTNFLNEDTWWVEKKAINISFFMPAYNCADTVIDSVESIMTGNFADGDEVVIVDDGSTDDTAIILDQLKEKYNGIMVVKHFSNRGGGVARNTAIQNTKHNILFCLDSDNVLEPASINCLKNFLQNTGADIAAFQELYFFQHDKEKIDFKWTFKPGAISIDDHLISKKVPGASGNYMFTKASWAKAGGYPEVVLDTWGFGFRQIMTGAKMFTMPGSFYYHRYGHESYWMRGAERRKQAVSLMALQILLPFSDKIDENYLDYIMSRKGRYTWFENLQDRPILLAKEQKKEIVWENDNALPVRQHGLNVLKKMAKNLLTIHRISKKRV